MRHSYTCSKLFCRHYKSLMFFFVFTLFMVAGGVKSFINSGSGVHFDVLTKEEFYLEYAWYSNFIVLSVSNVFCLCFVLHSVIALCKSEEPLGIHFLLKMLWNIKLYCMQFKVTYLTLNFVRVLNCINLFVFNISFDNCVP